MRTYHERWFRREGRAIGAISADEAKARYSTGAPFCVVVRSAGGVPVGFVEVAPGSFGVGFLDERGGVHLHYSFIEIDGALFLSQAICFESASDGDGPQTNYFFRPDGATTVERAPLGSTSGTTQSGTTDVAGNWEPKPDFEDICTLLRSER